MARKIVPMMFPILVGILLSAFVPEPTAGQGCGWCEDKRVWWKPWEHRHWFPNGNDSCGRDNRQEQCSRCGTGLGCHTEEDEGECHILCGPAGEPTALLDAVEEVRMLLDAGDAAVVAAMVQSDRADLTVAYHPAAGRIDFILPCDPAAPAATVAVLPGVRSAFEAALSAGSTVAALGPRADRILATPQ